MSGTIERCSFCPQLCRHVCPVAVATGREAATPAKIMATILLARRGRVPPEDAARAAALCTGCGACERHCKHSVEVPRLLAEARAQLATPASVLAPAAVEGEGTMVAIACDERRWAPSLAQVLRQPVASLVTLDHLGHAALEHRSKAAAQLARVHAVLAGRTAVSSCSHCLAVLDAAGVPHVRLASLLDLQWEGPVFACHSELVMPGIPLEDGPSCCGAHGPLARIHPEAALDVARDAAQRLPSEPVGAVDSVCRGALRAAGAAVLDPVDLLLEQTS
jgi:ferredoxin